MEMTEFTAGKVSKTARYGWVTKDEPGDMRMIHKDDLRINDVYQREVLQAKVKEITAAWSWLSLGALVVAHRNGVFWVIDGQHRLLASMRRVDITHLPCVVFNTMDVKSEAQGFFDLNANRKPVSAIDKHKALTAADDEVAVFVHQQIESLWLQIKVVARLPGQIKCLGWCMKRAAENKASFRAVLEFCADLSKKDDIAIQERLLEGVWMLNAKCGGGLADKRLAKRLREKGASKLLDAATRAAVYYVSGGGGVWAQGMLNEINKNLQIKFTMNGQDT